jgi:hypothetical protein
MERLTLEKQFSHAMFCQQIEELELESAKKLLADLHLLYLNQQSIFVELAKQDSTRSFGLG